MSQPPNPYEPAPPVGEGQAPYGASMPPVGYDQYGAPPVPAGPPPSPVVTATRLMFVSAGLSVIGFIVLLASKNSVRDAIQKKNPDYDSHKLDTAVNSLVVATVVIGIIFVVLYVLLALQLQKGKQWARVVTWVITGLGVLSALSSLAQTTTGVSRILSLIGGIVDLAIIILLAQKVSNAYFRRRAV